MKKQNLAVLGIYSDQRRADNAVTLLKAQGFRSTDISLLVPDPRGSASLVPEKGSIAPEGAAIGAVIGAVVGIAVGSITNVGPLEGAAIGSLTGAVIGVAIGVTIPEYKAIPYRGTEFNRKVLLSAHCDDEFWAERARKCLEESGAQDIASTSETVQLHLAPTPRSQEAAGILA